MFDAVLRFGFVVHYCSCILFSGFVLNLLCLLFLIFVFVLNSWLCFWWVVLPSCCLHACIALVICSCAAFQFVLVLASPSTFGNACAAGHPRNLATENTKNF